MQNKQNILIIVLTFTATWLLIANSFTTHRAEAYSIKDRDYQVVTVQSEVGGQVLYVTDNRSGQVAVFSWDANAKGLKLRDRKVLADLLGGGKK